MALTRPHGMTLLELMVVVSITGVIAGLAVPSISALAVRSRARLEVRELRTFLASASQQGRLRRECARVRILPEGLRISFHPRDAAIAAPHRCDFTAASALPEAEASFQPRLLDVTHTGELQLDAFGAVVGPESYVLEARVRGTPERHRFRVVTGTGVPRRLP